MNGRTGTIQENELCGEGTTLTAVLAGVERALIAHLGDSPVARRSTVRSPADRRYPPPAMHDDFMVVCPYCGEEVEVRLESDVEGSLVQDCEVCCNPWLLRVSGEDDDRHVDVKRADGSE